LVNFYQNKETIFFRTTHPAVVHIDIVIGTTIIQSTTTNFIHFVNVYSALFSFVDPPQALKHMALNPFFLVGGGVLNSYILMPEVGLQDRDV
jgi:hypothetical protein